MSMIGDIWQGVRAIFMRCKKMLYIALGIFIIFFVYLASGCSIYYPTSYRAFIPKSLDSEYKEYERLCKEEVGKVVYARPVGEGVKLENLDSRYRKFYKLSNNISVEIGTVSSPQLFYIFISSFRYYTDWTRKSFSMHDDSKEYISCKPLLYGKDRDEEALIIKKMAFNNKEYIGTEYEKIIFNPNRKWETDMEEILQRAINFKAKESK